jgi:large subunit ribosomal protein L25
MSDVTLRATKRTEFGKGPSRRLRRADQIPAVLYGHGTEPVHLALPGHDTGLALKNPNVLLTIAVEGEPDQLALPKAVQRDVLRGFVEHVDLIAVRRGEKVVVDIAVHVEGEPESGAVLTLEHPTLSVRADATSLPEGVTVDVSGLVAGSTITAAEISLDGDVELVTDPEAAVVVVSAPQIEAEPTEGEEIAEGEVPTVGAEADASADTEGEQG